MAVLVVAALFWVFSLAPTDLVRSGTAVTVPDVSGLSWEAGSTKLTDLGLEPTKVEKADEKVEAGFIIDTDIDPGATVAPGQPIEVRVSSGKAKVTLPNLSFATEDAAKEAIVNLGLTYGTTTQSYSPNVAAGLVMGVQPEGREDVVTTAIQVEQGSTVNLIVSNGLVSVPDLVGRPITEAQATLSGAAYQLTVKVNPDSGCSGQAVTGQSLKGDAPQKSTITLSYCAG